MISAAIRLLLIENGCVLVVEPVLLFGNGVLLVNILIMKLDFERCSR